MEREPVEGRVQQSEERRSETARRTTGDNKDIPKSGELRKAIGKVRLGLSDFELEIEQSR